MHYPFQFVHHTDPGFIYTGEVVLHTFLVTWTPQYNLHYHKVIPAPTEPTRYTTEKMAEFFADGTWVLV